jgi:sigma-70-like protein
MAASPVDAAYLASLRRPRELESAVDRVRRKLTVLPNGRTRARTIPPAALSRDERLKGEETSYPDVDRPRTRGDCSGQPRPCPWISCSHHLYLDANPKTGAIKLNFPALEVWEMTESCSLDVADRAGVTLKEVGRIYNLTRERIRQIETNGIRAIEESRESAGLCPPIDRTVYPPAGKGPHSGCP